MAYMQQKLFLDQSDNLLNLKGQLNEEE